MFQRKRAMKKDQQFGLVPSEKIFGIGLGKTGTRSLAVAAGILGYKKNMHGKGASTPLEIVRDLQFFGDVVAASRYKFLDYCFPEAKFILTIRDINSWIESCRQMEVRRGGYTDGNDKFIDGMIATKLDRAYNRFLLFGRVNFNEEDFCKAYYKHLTEVVEHFDKIWESKLLIMDICDGDGWEVLCPFLGCEIPDRFFPHRNRGDYDTEDSG